MFIDKSFDYRILTKAIKLLGKKNSKLTLINIGAHIGSTGIPVIKKNNFKNLIAFEPTKRNFRLLKANIFLNEIDDRVQAYNLAISNKKANLYLAIKRGNIGGNYISKNKQKNTEIVKSDILDNYTYNLNKNNSLIFIDAEGHEPNIFLGAKKTIKKKIQSGAQVLGIGGVHYYSVRGQTKVESKYDHSTLESTISSKLAKHDADIGGDYASTDVSNLILVKSYMEALNIKEVEAFRINLADGVLLSGKSLIK